MTINEYWEARLADPYVGSLARMGWEWTMALIDEDIDLLGEKENHEAARRGLRDAFSKGPCPTQLSLNAT